MASPAEWLSNPPFLIAPSRVYALPHTQALRSEIADKCASAMSFSLTRGYESGPCLWVQRIEKPLASHSCRRVDRGLHFVLGGCGRGRARLHLLQNRLPLPGRLLPRQVLGDACLAHVLIRSCLVRLGSPGYAQLSSPSEMKESSD